MSGAGALAGVLGASLDPEDWVTVRRLAEATGNSTSAIYALLYDKDDPMPCARRGRAIRVRLADLRAWWAKRTTTITPAEPARAPSKPAGVV